MKLSYGYIREYLNERYAVLSADEDTNSQYSMPTLYSKRKDMESGRIYLVDYPGNEEAFVNNDVMVIYCYSSDFQIPNGNNTTANLRVSKPCRFIYLDIKDTEVITLFEGLIELFRKNADWIEKLEELHFSKTTNMIKDYLDASVYFCNSALLYFPLDEWRECIFSTASSYDLPSLKNLLDETGKGHAELADYGALQKTIDSNEPVVQTLVNKETIKLLCVAVRENSGSCLGILAMPIAVAQECGTEAQIWFITKFRDILEKHLVAHPSLIGHESLTYHGIIRQLLFETSSSSIRNTKKHIKTHEYTKNSTFVCALMHISSEGNQKIPFNQICSIIESKGNRCFAVEYETNIVILIDTDSLVLEPEAFIRSVLSYIAPFQAEAGISNSFNDILLLRDYMRQAKAALKVGSELRRHKLIHRFADVACAYIVRYGSSELPVRLLCAPGILTLQKLSDQGSIDFLETLRAHIRNSCNATLTARELYIHRSTLLHRLERIESITQLDPKDPDERLYIELSLTLISRYQYTIA